MKDIERDSSEKSEKLSRYLDDEIGKVKKTITTTTTVGINAGEEVREDEGDLHETS